MKQVYFILTFLMLGIFVSAQPFDTAPKTSKKIRQIIEWVRPNLEAKSEKGMTSIFDKRGYLTAYTSTETSSILNTHHSRDHKGRILESKEGEGTNLYMTKYYYKSDRIIKETTYRGKVNRALSFLNKKGLLIEKKKYAKGLELGNTFRLKERIIYEYNKRNQIIGEKTMSYDLPNSREFNTRKKIYRYHSVSHLLLKTIEYDYDGTVSVVEDFAYYKDKKIKSIITNYFKDKTVGTKEFLYQKGKIWQRISTERGLRHVEIFKDGRLLRLRSYNNDKIYRVVDYQYVYW